MVMHLSHIQTVFQILSKKWKSWKALNCFQSKICPCDQNQKDFKGRLTIHGPTLSCSLQHYVFLFIFYCDCMMVDSDQYVFSIQGGMTVTPSTYNDIITLYW